MSMLPAHIETMRPWLKLADEVIVVDSFSDDGTAEYAKKHIPHRNIRVLSHPRGLYQSWNFGIQQTKGTWVYISTVGDQMTKGLLQHLRAQAELLDCDVMASRPVFITEDGGPAPQARWPIHHIIKAYTPQKQIRLSGPEAFLYALFNIPCAVLGSSASNLYRGDHLRARPFPTGFGTTGDTAWTLEYGLNTRFGFTAEQGSFFRLHEKAYSPAEYAVRNLQLKYCELAVSTLARTDHSPEVEAGIGRYRLRETARKLLASCQAAVTSASGSAASEERPATPASNPPLLEIAGVAAPSPSSSSKPTGDRSVTGDEDRMMRVSAGDPMSILFIAHDGSLYGANRSLLNLIDGLREKENVFMQVIVPHKGALSEALKGRGVRCWIVPFQYNTRLASDPENPGRAGAKSEILRPMLNVVARTKPDIIYSNSSVIYYGAWLARLTRKPHVWHLREYGDLDYGLAPDLGRDFLRARLGESAFAIAISRSIDQYHLSGLAPDRKRIIYNGVARMNECASAPRELVEGRPLRLAILGLVQPTKGQLHAIEAVRLLRETFPGIVLQIVGGGEARHVDQLKATVREYQLEQNVIFSGVISEPLEWLRNNADILLMCSQNEAFGRVTAEAMTQAIPVIGTATGGTTEIITDGRNGLLYNGKSDDLAAKVIQLAANAARYREMSAFALEDSRQRFTSERYVTEIYAVLEAVMKQTKQSVPASEEISEVPVPPVPLAKADLFLEPPLTADNCDLYWVRSSIQRAVREAMPFFHGTLLDVGCGVMPYRQMIMRSAPRVTRYVGLDIETQIYDAAVDLRWDGRRIPLEDASVDCVMSTEVLEHCPEPLVVLKEIRRVLKPGGAFFFTVPYLWPLHDAPHDFYRYTPFSLEKLLAGADFEHADVQALGGWNASLAQMLGLWMKRAPMSDEARSKMTERLWPFYRELVQADEVPTDPKAGNTMSTGWKGMAFSSRATGGPEVSKVDLPLVLVRCHESKYSETFIEDHVNHVSSECTLLHGASFPRFLRGGRSIFPEAFEDRLRSTGAAGGKAAAALWRDYGQGMADFLKSSGARVALIETGLMGAFLYQACEVAGLPYVVHFHGVDATGREILEHWGRHYTRFFRTAAAIVVVSEAMRTQLLRLGAPADRVVLSPYGVAVDLPVLADPGRSTPRFIAVGRFVEKKGPEKTLQAFAIVHRRVPTASLVMVGDGPLQASCRRWVQANGLRDAVTFVGVQSRQAVSHLMAGSRVFVQHSIVAKNGDSEGLPLAVLEAGAHGLPVVATRHAGIPDAVTDEVHGYLVPEGDVQAMAERMIVLAEDPELAGRLGAAYRERVCADFSRNVSIQRLQQILTRVAEGKGPVEAEIAELSSICT